ncbi:hypothetical protein SpCBS45565_g08363 [Spizellomyces sp. 'palustris']|nr:hypothetical protein SpCBS45565_g08363 [Spizellomyces sp. 'palustris']
MNYSIMVDDLKIAKKKLMNRGFLPIPADLCRKCPLGHWKRYTVKDWSKSTKLITGAKANVGILTGIRSGVIVIHIDNKAPKKLTEQTSHIYCSSTSLEDWNLLCKLNGGMPQTLKCSTPSGGFHYHFQYDEAFAKQVKTTNSCVMSIDDLLCTIDIRGDSSFVVRPPSSSENGSYCWLPNHKIGEIPILPLPEWIKSNILNTCMKKSHTAHKTTEQATFTQPCTNDLTGDEDFELFKASPYYHEHHFIKIDEHNRIILKETQDFECSICNCQHINHSNHPFLVRHGSRLLFVCRQSSGDKHFTAWITPSSVPSDKDVKKEKEEAKDSPHYILMQEIWSVSQKHKYMKSDDGWIYKPLEGKPCAYKPHLKSEDFVNVVLEDNKIYKSSPKCFEDIMCHLKNIHDKQLPWLKPDLNILAFTNGVIFLDTVEFVPYTDKRCQGKIVRHFIDQVFTGKTHTPCFNKLINHQIDCDNPEESKKVYNAILALLGRLFFRVNQHDKLKISPLLYGDSNMGKTTIVNIAKHFFPPSRIAVISSNTERSFGLENLYDKDFIAVPEVPSKMSDFLDAMLFQQMIDGDHTNVAVKHKTAFTGEFKGHILGAGNWFYPYPDPKGALMRRIPIINFERYVDNHNSSLEQTVVENELPDLINKCLLAYWDMMRNALEECQLEEEERQSDDRIDSAVVMDSPMELPDPSGDASEEEGQNGWSRRLRKRTRTTITDSSSSESEEISEDTDTGSRAPEVHLPGLSQTYENEYLTPRFI